MTGKEALDKLFMAVDEELLYEQSGYIFATELTKSIEQDLDRLKQLEKENQELKEAISILKLVSSLNCDKTLETERNFLRLTQEEYELLKEVFESVGGDVD